MFSNHFSSPKQYRRPLGGVGGYRLDMSNSNQFAVPQVIILIGIV